jgi:hypothetical protein
VLSDAEGQMLADFLDGGGRLYMEGGDTWYYNSPTPVHDYFHINGVADGSGSFEMLIGDTSSFMKGFVFDYQGANNWMDEIEPLDDAFVILKNESSTYDGPAVIAYENETYKTIGSVAEFGGLEPGGPLGSGGNQAGYMAEMLNFFGVNFTWTGVENQNMEDGQMTVSPNPATNVVNVQFNEPSAKKVEVKIYDVTGRVVLNEAVRVHQGNNKITLDVSSLSNGFYTMDIVKDGSVSTQKLIITK